MEFAGTNPHRRNPPRSTRKRSGTKNTSSRAAVKSKLLPVKAKSNARGTRKMRKAVPWSGWGKVAPKGHERTLMLRKCGPKCFLGPEKSFPICAKNTCKPDDKGIYAAYVRARQWGKSKSSYKGKARPRHGRSVYTKVARKAKRMLTKRGYKVGKSKRTRRRSRK